MKLNSKILISNALLSLFMLIVTSLGTYYVVNTTIYDELDFHLLQHKFDIQQQLQKDPESLDEIRKLGGLGSYEWVEIHNFDQSISIGLNNISTVDTVRNPDVSTLAESYRKLTTTLSVGNDIYLLEIYEEVAAWDKISMTVILSVLAALFIWVVLLYIVNQFVFGKVLAPFYDTVDRLEHISSPSQVGEPFPEPNTYEIRVLNTALNTMLTQIKSSFDDQRKFIQNASHELLTPLSIIRQKAEKMISDADNLAPNSIERLHEIQQTAVRLTRLSNALLLISRVENRQFEMDNEIDVAQVTNQVLSELKDFIQIKDLQVDKDLNQNIRLSGNKELIHSALYNIIQNAIKFSPNGGSVRIYLKTNDSGRTILSVSDEGPGIPEDLIQKIFDRFKKGENISDHNNSSPGLGLSIVKSICELHNLGYFAKNNADRGVTFTLIF
ncbi:sensor histidine kinase [Gracilimonas sp.]|uniref:sensor histidine kinase n=1 Tax=Gracilimonas sp. TaxID=1974203 RepID=UPI002871FE63|nr:HAMP domain-containing sensor histidine kinase [Gracilimonas sp.]